MPFINICKEHHTAVRIGVNHGSLSDRIMSRYGDTPEGIVESCMDFLRIFRRERFNDVVISIKASNTVVMVRTVRLLVTTMEAEDMHYPLHLGVTEAGEGEDGRIKSAVGIGALLADGIGDTIRVSLSEEPECEIPVARYLVRHNEQRAKGIVKQFTPCPAFDWTRPVRRKTHAVGNIGGDNPPVVMQRAPLHKLYEGDPLRRPDYYYHWEEVPEVLDPNVAYIFNEPVWDKLVNHHMACRIDHDDRHMPYEEHVDTVPERVYPMFHHHNLNLIDSNPAAQKFLTVGADKYYGDVDDAVISCLRRHPEVVVVAIASDADRTSTLRYIVHRLWSAGLTNPVVMKLKYLYECNAKSHADVCLEAAADAGALMMDGLVDGLFVDGSYLWPSPAFDILQAGRLRMTKTEYISCPGCGRTLYNLQETIARIKKATAHLSGLKIGIMGCIVNGPGEMADADYGYVGAGRGKISLYRQKECVQKNIPEEEAVDRLLELIENDRRVAV